MITTNNTTELIDLAHELDATTDRAELVQTLATRMMDIARDADTDWRTRRDVIRPVIDMLAGRLDTNEVDSLLSAINSRLSMLKILGDEDKLFAETPVLLSTRHALEAARRMVA